MSKFALTLGAACLAVWGAAAQAGSWSNQDQAGAYEFIGSSESVSALPEMVGTSYGPERSAPGGEFSLMEGGTIHASAGIAPSGYGTWSNCD